MTDHATIMDTYREVEAENGGPYLADVKACAVKTAERLGLAYETVREALLDANGGLFG